MKKNNLIALASRITEKANRFIVKELENRGIEGIVPSHGGIMAQLFSGEQYTMKELADRIHRTKPTITVLVDKLVNKGYVTKEKSLEDSRITYIRLTEKGWALQPYFAEISAKMNAIVYSGLSDEAAAELEIVLAQVNNKLGE